MSNYKVLNSFTIQNLNMENVCLKKDQIIDGSLFKSNHIEYYTKIGLLQKEETPTINISNLPNISKK